MDWRTIAINMKKTSQKTYLMNVINKEREANDRKKEWEKFGMIFTMLNTLGKINNNIIRKIYQDFKDLTPCLDIGHKFLELKEKLGDYNDNRIYNLVKNNLSEDKHPIIKKVIKFTNLSVDKCIFWCKSGNYHFETIKKLYLNI